MKYNITQYDKDLLLQSEIQYKYKLLVLSNNKQVIDELTSLQTIGSYSIDSSSSIRRTTSFTMYLDNSYKDLFKILIDKVIVEKCDGDRNNIKLN